MHLEKILYMGLRRKSFLTKNIFFDTDCISAFLWVNNESLLTKIYSGRIIIPKAVYDELSHPRVEFLKRRVDILVKKGHAKIESIEINTDEYRLYYKLTRKPEHNRKIIGKGEAASISLAKKYDGIIASNNFRDIVEYVNEFSLEHITTADILVIAYNRKIITILDAEKIWSKMLSKRRKLGANSFAEYLNNKKDI